MQALDLEPGTIRLMGFNYNQDRQTLDVTSNCGTVYQYFNVPEKVINELKQADDQGNFYKTTIRGKFKRLFKAYDYSVIF